MKKTLTLLLTSLNFLAYSQIKNVKNVKWLSTNLGGIGFYKDQLNWRGDNFDVLKRYYISNDTLVMFDRYTWNRDTTWHTDLFKFKMVIKGDKSLTIIPLDQKAKELAQGKMNQFTNIKYIYDESIKFSRIHLNAGLCYGTCPELSIDIDDTGTYYLKGGEYAEPYKGYFKGRLSVKQLDTLNYYIKHSAIEQMQTWTQKLTVMDTPPYSLILYYNGKKLSVSTNWPPNVIEDLLKYLMSTYRKVNLIPDPDKHEFN
jgi:hypothetical protein